MSEYFVIIIRYFSANIAKFILNQKLCCKINYNIPIAEVLFKCSAFGYIQLRSCGYDATYNIIEYLKD